MTCVNTVVWFWVHTKIFAITQSFVFAPRVRVCVRARSSCVVWITIDSNRQTQSLLLLCLKLNRIRNVKELLSDPNSEFKFNIKPQPRQWQSCHWHVVKNVLFLNTPFLLCGGQRARWRICLLHTEISLCLAKYIKQHYKWSFSLSFPSSNSLYVCIWISLPFILYLPPSEFMALVQRLRLCYVSAETARPCTLDPSLARQDGYLSTGTP